MYRNNTSPWLQKHNPAAPHTQDRKKYRHNINGNVYSMLQMTLIIAVFVSPSQIFLYFSFTVDLLYFLNYSMSILSISGHCSFTRLSAVANLHTPTQGHVVMGH